MTRRMTLRTRCASVSALSVCAALTGCGDDDDGTSFPDGGFTDETDVNGAGGAGGMNGMGGAGGDASEGGAGGMGSSLPDAGLPDASVDDGGLTEAGLPDAATMDGSVGDASMADGGMGSLVYPVDAVIDNASVPSGFVAWQWADELEEPRGMLVDASGNVLVVEQDTNWIVALWDDDGDGVSGTDERAIVAEADGLNHGIALSDGYLYASSDTTVYRWEYTEPRMDLGPGTAVVTGIPGGGRHQTRTLLFDEEYLYVSVGSGGNVDEDSSRARIVRFPVGDLDAGSEWSDGSVFADGLRNEVGLGLDAEGRVWGVENGLDQLYDEDLGGDIHNQNPGEELNLFVTPGAFYGYPYCWTEYEIESDAGGGRGTQWLFEDTTEGDGQPFDGDSYSDEWCQDPSNVVPPELVMPGHVAPLDILFYADGSFPDAYDGDALVTFHGSWNATPAVGYKVVRVLFEDGMPTGEWEPLYEYDGSGDTGDDWQERPVDLAVIPDGPLLVTSDDDADRIIAIGYE